MCSSSSTIPPAHVVFPVSINWPTSTFMFYLAPFSQSVHRGIEFRLACDVMSVMLALKIFDLEYTGSTPIAVLTPPLRNYNCQKEINK